MLASAVTASSTHRIATSYYCYFYFFSTDIDTSVLSDESSAPDNRFESLCCQLQEKKTPSLVMMASRTALCIFVVFLAFVSLSAALPAGDKERFLNELDLVDDDGSIETALINYLFTKQVVKRLRSQMDIGDLQRKRSYWKQCAFNAVSCFGK